MNKKLITLPVALIALIVITTVLTTGINVNVQALMRQKDNLSEKNQAITEEMEASSSLSSAIAVTPSMGFASARVVSFVTAANSSIALK